MDLTSACPSVSVEASIGPETWATYNARAGAALAQTAEWDGLLVDRSDGNESWLLGNSTARSIDASRTNRVPAIYSTFDSAWNAGLLGYELRLRELVGEDRLLLANWGHPNYSALNGNNFEGFPNADPTAYAWQRSVVGPWADHGSYFEWLSQARQPNLTTIETYEDDGSPDATDDGAYDNPAERPGFVPNYRKMRYGLATALLGGGFFSYEINTNGHGSLGLLWFDEYDGAGRGRGWLGAPTGSATRVGSAGAGGDLLGGSGGFESDAALETWDFSTEPGAAATITRDLADKPSGTSAAQVHITAANGTDWHVSAAHGAAIVGGASYTLRFWARADATHTVNAWVQMGRDPWDNEIEFGGVDVGTAWREYELTGTSSASDASAQLVLALGGSTGDVWLDDVRM
ncbi:MAG: putative glycoside hydrolase, partial [Actinomycetota bacterium]|nr:putative glycoside hydrolase [Actinomycetota bacterium]